MAVTEEDLDNERKAIEKLRGQVADTQAKAEQRVRDQANVVEHEALKAERARLEAQLAVAREQAKAATVKEGASGVLDQVKDEREAAENLAKSAKEGK